MNENKEFQSWIKQSPYAKTESLKHRIFDSTRNVKFEVNTIFLLKLAFEAGQQSGNEKFKKQIDKMKCCYNCNNWEAEKLDCQKVTSDKISTYADCCCDNWEIKKGV